MQGSVAAKNYLATKSIKSGGKDDPSPERVSAGGHQQALQGSQGRQQRRKIVIPPSASSPPQKSKAASLKPADSGSLQQLRGRKLSNEELETCVMKFKEIAEHPKLKGSPNLLIGPNVDTNVKN